MDGILVHSQEWQGFIDKVQERYEIKEIASWDEYIDVSMVLRNVMECFIKILIVYNKEWSLTKDKFKKYG